MYYDDESLIPHIYPSEYDSVASEFLDRYYPAALTTPMPVPILKIATEEMKMDVKFLCLSEDMEIYGMTIFADGYVDIYDPEDGIFKTQKFPKRTILIDPEAYKRTNEGCVNNTIAHECLHWFKHRMYYRMQAIQLPRIAKYCKCSIHQLPTWSEDEVFMERQAVGIAPRILMPKNSFLEKAASLGISDDNATYPQIIELADFFKVSRQSASIRLRECEIV